VRWCGPDCTEAGPCGFSPGESNAVLLGVGTTVQVLVSSGRAGISRCAGTLRRLNGTTHLWFVICDRLCGRDRGNRVVRAPAIPSRRAPPRCFRRSKRVMRRRDLRAAFRYPRGSSFRDRAGRIGPSLLLPPGGAHGVQCPSQVCSRKRVETHFCISGPTCPFGRDDPTRFIFVGVILARPLR